jgi:macrolide transport system ATP-binding/permease protein
MATTLCFRPTRISCFKKDLPEFDELAAMESGFDYRPLTARREGPQAVAKSMMGEFVSGNYFRTFGLQPTAGHFFTDADDAKGAAFTAVMSYDTWAHDYGSDPGIVGSTFLINTQPVTIIGIAPKGYFGDRLTSNPPNFYLPIESMTVIFGVPYLHDPEVAWVYIVGRVKPGISLPTVQAKASTLLLQQFSTFKVFTNERAKTFLGRTHVVLTPGGAGIQQLQDDAKSQLHLLSWIAALVLLVACANIANLQLVRSMSRRGEMCVRTALGAQRSHIIRQLLTESVLLAGLGGIVGLAVAYAGARMLLAMAFPGAQNIPINAAPSPLVIGFAFALSLLTGILFGVAPAWIAAQAQPAEVLRSGSRTVASGASLLQRGSWSCRRRSPWCSSSAPACLRRASTSSRTPTCTSTRRTATSFTSIRRLPDTPQRKLSALSHHGGAVPRDSGRRKSGHRDLHAHGRQQLEQQHPGAGQPRSEQGRVLCQRQCRVLRLRRHACADGARLPAAGPAFCSPVVVVNQEFVKQFFKPDENPIGHRIGSPGPQSAGDFEIVGVVDDTTYTAVQWKDHAMFFVPITQRPASEKSPIATDVSLYAGAMVIAADRPMNGMEKLAQRTLSGINPNLTIVKFQNFDQQIADRFNDNRMIAQLTSLFGGLALLLATIGLYGVTSYTVVRRTSEIGIRMALGAERTRVIGMVMRGAMTQAILGLIVGVPVAMLCVRYIKAQLYEIASVDLRRYGAGRRRIDRCRLHCGYDPRSPRRIHQPRPSSARRIARRLPSKTICCLECRDNAPPLPRPMKKPNARRLAPTKRRSIKEKSSARVVGRPEVTRARTSADSRQLVLNPHYTH